jgi:dihydrofolate synthase / folylpolyglutamate synthase
MPSPSLQNLDEQYSKTVDFLCSMERFGILLGLENVSQLLERLGNPQRKFPVVHVAGSNGKGSTSSFVYEVLQEAGLRTALYTSPHLNDFRERIKLNGAMISKEALIASTEKISALYDPGRTTFFEFTTAVAFDCMAQEAPDMAVIEVGLGGRLDATNTVSPCVTVITDISREHEDYLGTGISAIATEKAGIIKRGVPLITGATRKQARSIILETARGLQAPVKEFGRHFVGRRTGLGRFTYRSGSLALESLSLSMPGSHQVKNAAIAVAVVEELRTRGYRISDNAVRNGIEKTRFPGRFEILLRDPDVIIDGAHTPEGMRLLKSTLRQIYPGVKPYMLLGMLKDKNYKALIKIISPIAREVVCVPPQGDRALDPDELAEQVRACGVPTTASRDITEGFQLLLKKASKKDVIVAAGSLYMIGPVRRACGIGDA